MNLHRIQNDLIRIAVSGSGAELKSLTGRSGREWMWQASPEFWPRTAPVLFPVVGKLNDNSFRYKGVSYPLPQHGFARDREFILTASGNNHLLFSLESDAASFRHFPFHFKLEIGYRISGCRLEVSWTVKNHSEGSMPFSIGGHPGFSLPGWPAKKWYLVFEREEVLASHPLKDGLLDSGEKRLIPQEEGRLEITRDLFLQDALVFSGLGSSHVSLSSQEQEEMLRFHFAGFPFLGIWSRPGAPFVCIEPWHGHADPPGFKGEISEKPGIILLEPEGVFQSSYAIELIAAG